MTYRSFSLISVFINYLLSNCFMQIDDLFSHLTDEKLIADMLAL